MPRNTKEKMYLPTVELVLYEARGEWRIAMTVFDGKFQAITMESVLGSDRTKAETKVQVIARRLGLVRERGTTMWRRLVPSKEF